VIYEDLLEKYGIESIPTTSLTRGAQYLHECTDLCFDIITVKTAPKGQSLLL